MATTYTFIASQTLTSTAATVTFSSIPQTFTDLVLRASVKSNNVNQSAKMRMRVNGNSGSVYSSLVISHDGGSASNTQRNLVTDFDNMLRQSGSASNAYSFASVELMIPSYTVSQHKPMLAISSFTGNSDGGNYYSINQAQDNNPITSILLFNDGSEVFSVGSSFFLYGISNA